MKPVVISVVIPVFNGENYLKQTIDSILSQTIELSGLEVLLIDDGSTDETPIICGKYADMYPGTIRYVRQVNGGVSKARNKGLSLSRGKYVHFLDADDVLSSNFYSESVKFLVKHGNQVDFVASKIKFFDASIDSHPLNYKFNKTRVINLDDTPNNPILHAATCVFIRDKIKNLAFDERLKITEDAKFLSEVLYSRRSYGVLSRTTYFYRKHQTELSALGGKLKNRSYYIDTPRFAYLEMIDLWRKRKKVHQYIQRVLLYDLSYRLNQKTQTVLSESEELQYKRIVKECIQYIDDSVIMESSHLDVHTKSYLLGIKSFDSDKVKQVIEEPMCTIDFITHIDHKSIKIEGYIEGVSSFDDIVFSNRGELISATQVPRSQREVAFLGDIIHNGGAFELLVPLHTGEKNMISVEVLNKRIAIKMNQFTRIGNIIGSYRMDDRWLIRRRKMSINVTPKTVSRFIGHELIFLIGISCNWKLSEVVSRLDALRTRNLSQLSISRKLVELIKPFLFSVESLALIPRAFVFRCLYHCLILTKKRDIWIISDRGMAAGDNGEALFRHAVLHQSESVDVYFSLSKKSTDYQRIRDVGPVLDYGSLRYKFKFLLADKIISSQADIEVTNPYLRQIDHYVDLYRFDFVFLQHGIIRNDLSDWLNRFSKNISLFIASSHKEYASLLKYPYYYEDRQLLLSGMPRYDYLESNPKNKIIIAPTYRKSLLRSNTDKNGARVYDNEFKNTDYCIFYNNLINDNRILDRMKKGGIVGEVYIHPNFAAQLRDFNGNDLFTIMDYPYDYKRAINEGSLLVSDFSSLVFDFAYLRKPIIYSQFDIESFFDNHSYSQGDFYSDIEDGFGPVEYDYESLVVGVTEMIDENFSMDKVYSSKVDDFFYKIDKHNSMRVYDAIRKM